MGNVSGTIAVTYRAMAAYLGPEAA
jgi:hypothetical protein